MTYIPDCRTDENYNERYLNEKDKEFVKGYDWAVETVLNILNNADVYPDFADLLDPNKALVNVDKAEIVKDALEQWMEGERDMLITSMIDHMDEKEYSSIKEKVDHDTGREGE